MLEKRAKKKKKKTRIESKCKGKELVFQNQDKTPTFKKVNMLLVPKHGN